MVPRVQQNTSLGILLMSATALVFALQDGMSRHLAANYNVWMVVMIRIVASLFPGIIKSGIHRCWASINAVSACVKLIRL